MLAIAIVLEKERIKGIAETVQEEAARLSQYVKDIRSETDPIRKIFLAVSNVVEKQYNSITGKTEDWGRSNKETLDNTEDESDSHKQDSEHRRS